MQHNEWDLCKENIQPLESGRKIDALEKALSTSKMQFRAKVNYFENQLHETEEEENIEVWNNYIHWLEQHHTQKKKVVPLMQRFISYYKKTKKYNQNKTYVKLWLKLAVEEDEPQLMFEYMMNHDIGTEHALFYVTWAEYYEMIGAVKKSEELYTLGINRNANPVEVLHEARNDFTFRISKKPPMEGDMTQQPSRVALAGLKSTKQGTVSSNRLKHTVKSSSVGSSSSSSRGGSSSGFSIFEDNAKSSVLPSATAKGIVNLPSKSHHRENTKEMTAIKGTKLPNSGASSATTKFEIYTEEQSEPTQGETPRQVFMGARKPLSTVKPSKHMTLEEQGNEKFKVKYNKQEIYMGGREVSFEELKALLCKYSSCKKASLDVNSPAKKKAKVKLEYQNPSSKGNEHFQSKNDDEESAADISRMLTNVNKQDSKFQSSEELLSEEQDNNFDQDALGDATRVLMNINQGDELKSVQLSKNKPLISNYDNDVTQMISTSRPSPDIANICRDIDMTTKLHQQEHLEDSGISRLDSSIDPPLTEKQHSPKETKSSSAFQVYSDPTDPVAKQRKPEEISHQSKNAIEKSSAFEKLDASLDDSFGFPKKDSKSASALQIYSDPTQTTEKPKESFSIFSDNNTQNRKVNKPPLSGALDASLNDSFDLPAEKDSKPASAFQIYTDPAQTTHKPKESFSMFSDNNTQNKKIDKQVEQTLGCGGLDASLNDSVGFPLASADSKQKKSAFEIYSDEPTNKVEKTKNTFSIFCDDEIKTTSPKAETKNDVELNMPDLPTHSKATSAFQIYADPTQTTGKSKESFSIFSDNNTQNKKSNNSANILSSGKLDASLNDSFDFPLTEKKSSSTAFSIYSDPTETAGNRKNPFSIFSDDKINVKEKLVDFPDLSTAGCKTSTKAEEKFSIFTDNEALFKKPQKLQDETASNNKSSAFQIYSDTPDRPHAPKSSLSKNVLKERIPDTPEPPNEKRVFEIYSDATEIQPQCGFTDATPKRMQGFCGAPSPSVTVNRKEAKDWMNALCSDTLDSNQLKTIADNTHISREQVFDDNTTTCKREQVFNDNTTTCKREQVFNDNTTTCKPLSRVSSTPWVKNQQTNLTFNLPGGNITVGEHRGTVNVTDASMYEEGNLSTIAERSKESSSNSSSGDGLKLQDCPSTVPVFEKETLIQLMQMAMRTVYNAPNYVQIHSHLPKVKEITMELELGERQYFVQKALRKGNGSAIYKAENNQSKTIVELQISLREMNSLIWDFYITTVIHNRITEKTTDTCELHTCFMGHIFALKYEDAFCLESPFYCEGTLEDVVTLYKRHNRKLDEVLVLLYTREILQIVSTLHQCKIIHTGIAPDKFLLGESDMLGDKGACDLRCLVLKDFHYSVDLTMHPESTMFTGSRYTTYECHEMARGKPWKYKVDYFAAAATIHYLIFQLHLETYYDSDQLKIKQKHIESAWEVNLWQYILTTLTNYSNNTDSIVNNLIGQLGERLCNQEQQLKLALENMAELIMDDD